MTTSHKRWVRRIFYFIAYALPIYASVKWYPRYMSDINNPPRGFYVTLAIALGFDIVGLFLENEPDVHRREVHEDLPLV